MEALRAILRQQPENPLIHYMLANEHLKEQRFEVALAELETYLAKSDDEGAGYRMLASALLGLGRDAEAKEAYRRGIDAARRHHHASMVAEFEAALEEFA